MFSLCSRGLRGEVMPTNCLLHRSSNCRLYFVSSKNKTYDKLNNFSFIYITTATTTTLQVSIWVIIENAYLAFIALFLSQIVRQSIKLCISESSSSSFLCFIKTVSIPTNRANFSVTAWKSQRISSFKVSRSFACRTIWQNKDGAQSMIHCNTWF